ncbi:MAG: asparagine synthase (glutamine-hydrolyzing) [Gallionella sp.]|nr:asparagine synthase (glutamine-hydrolyzing) [Gallionella sp.]
MCGIAGLLSVDEFNAEHVWRMTRTLQHRGPDAQDIWIDPEGGVGLGHSRLSIIDLSPHGAQPMTSHSGRYVIAYNGEIYNATELRASLDKMGDGVTWRGHSDTEVLLAAIDRWGAEIALTKAEGMFAFALWDRGERSLLLARDRAGEKPLYYGFAGRAFVFGSELKAVRAAPHSDAEIDRAALARFTQLSYVPTPYSIYRNIRKLPAGCFLEVRADDLRERHWPEPRRFFSIESVASAGAKDLFCDEATAADALDAVLRRAVKAQMSSDVPLGGFLSGGVDSSTIVAMMQAQSTRAIQTFTVAFEEAGYDESSAAAGVARHLAVEHRELRVTAADAQAVIPMLPAMYDEPFADVSQIPTYLISSLARRHVTVALSGDGGDELFGGYNRYLWLPTIQRLTSMLPDRARDIAASALRRAPPILLKAMSELKGPVGQLGRRADLLPDLLLATGDPLECYQRAVQAWALPPVRDSAIDNSRLRHEHPLVVGGDFPSDMMLWDYLTYLADDVLTKVDRASMCTSLEVRCPFLDPSVTALAWRLPLSMKIRGSTGKWLLRQVLHRYVPEALVSQPKAGFSVPIGSWIRGPLREWAGDLLSEDRLSRQGFFDSQVICTTWDDHLSGRRDHSKRLWPILMFQAWLEEWGAN